MDKTNKLLKVHIRGKFGQENSKSPVPDNHQT